MLCHMPTTRHQRGRHVLRIYDQAVDSIVGWLPIGLKREIVIMPMTTQQQYQQHQHQQQCDGAAVAGSAGECRLLAVSTDPAPVKRGREWMITFSLPREAHDGAAAAAAVAGGGGGGTSETLTKATVLRCATGEQRLRWVNALQEALQPPPSPSSSESAEASTSS